MRRRFSSELCHAPTSPPEREPCPMVGREQSRRPHGNTPSGRHVFVIFSLCQVARRRGVGPIRRNAEAGPGPSRKECAQACHLLVSSELCHFARLGQAWVARSPLRRSAGRSCVATPRGHVQDRATGRGETEGGGISLQAPAVEKARRLASPAYILRAAVDSRATLQDRRYDGGPSALRFRLRNIRERLEQGRS